MPEKSVDESSGLAASQRLLPFMLLLFVGSGCAALIYEIVWLQLLQLVIGLTAASLGVLLGTFMGGMCLGSLLLPRLISPRFHPLRVYALLELGIALCGVVVLFAVPQVGHVYSAYVGHGMAGIALRGVVAAICLLPPTLLMGATLPAISRWVETTKEGVSWLGFFYGGNIAGAVFGCLLAGFYLLRIHDMAVATYVAATVNVAVALMALGLAAGTAHQPPVKNPAKNGIERAPGATAVYVAIALSGLTALGAEVVWTRLLALMLGACVYTFSIILAVFLVGLGIGSSAGSFLARTAARPALLLGWCQMLLAGTAGWAAYMITRSIPHWPVDPTISLSPWYTFQMDLAFTLWTILPAACLWGASFPLALAAVSSRGQDPGRLVGGVYASNTVGAIIGAVVFSLMVIPEAGTQTAQRLLIGLCAVSAVVALAPQFWPGKVGSTPAKPPLGAGAGIALAGGVALALWLVSTVAVIPWGVVAYGRFAATYGNRFGPDIVPEEKVPSVAGIHDIFCTYMGEGLNGTVAVTMRTDGVRCFHSAGKVQASNDPRDMRLQRMLGHISALAHPNPKSVLVVACGAGVTAGSFVLHPDVERIVICDIEPLVPEHVAPLFKKENYDVVNDKRVEIVRDDGRHYLRTTKEKFDVITSDPIDPWVKGCAALNTVDYYQMCKDRLNPGGVVSLWMALYENESVSVKSLIATFCQVFPNAIFWSNDDNGEGYDAVLFGKVEKTQIDLDELQARLDREDHTRVRVSLAEVGFHSAADLLATYAGQGPDMQGWMRDAQINTDLNLRLQYLAGMSFNSYKGREILSGITKYYRFPDEVFLGSETSKQMLKDRLRARQQ